MGISADLFRPRTVAVAGVPSNPAAATTGVNGATFLRGLKDLGFGLPERGGQPGDRRLFAVNPKATETDGVPCYPSLRDIPGDVEYVISSIPASAVPQLIEDAIVKNTRVIHFFTAGFSETGDEERAELEQQVLARAREAGIRLVGPNCMGVYMPASGLAFGPSLPQEPGGCGLLAQSGAIAQEVVRYAAPRGVRFSMAVSYGNAADLNETDFLEYFANDPDTRVIAAYIEGVRDGRRFVKVLREAAARKPVIILKGGRTEAGSRAASSHTASLAGSLRVFDALCQQMGALRAEGLDELLDLIVGFYQMEPPAGPGVAIVGGGGGPSVLAADACAAAGLQMPTMPEDVQREFAEFVPVAGTSVRNPIDAMAVGTPGTFTRTLRLAARPESVHSVLYHSGFGGIGPAAADASERIDSQIRNLIEAREKGGKPIVLVAKPPPNGPGLEQTALYSERASAAGFAVFPSVTRAANTLSALLRWRDQHEDGA